MQAKSNNHSIKPEPAVLLGRDGEDAAHLYARLLARDCVDDETEHVVAQVVARLDACEADGQRACERKTCDALRHDAPGRCAADLQIALNARNRP